MSDLFPASIISTRTIKAIFENQSSFSPSKGYLYSDVSTEKALTKFHSLISTQKSNTRKQNEGEVNNFITALHYKMQHNQNEIELSGNRVLIIHEESDKVIITLKKPRIINFFLLVDQIIHIATLNKDEFVKGLKIQANNIDRNNVASYFSQDVQCSEEKFAEFDAKLNDLHYLVGENPTVPTLDDFKNHDFLIYNNKVYFINNNNPYNVISIDKKTVEASFPSSTLQISLRQRILENEYKLNMDSKYPRLCKRKKPNQAYVINYGSGCKSYEKSRNKLDLHLAARIKKLKELVGTAKVLDNDGPTVITSRGFDNNVKASAQFMLKHIIEVHLKNKADIGNNKLLEINLNLIGYSRGATETIAAYNILQKYLRGDTDIPPKLKKSMDAVINSKIKSQLQYDLKNNYVQLTVHMLLLDPVRGPTNGKYAIYGKVIEEPFGGENSQAFIDVCVCNQAILKSGIMTRLENKILELSHVTIKSNKIHLRHNQTNSSHTHLDVKPTKARNNILPAALIDNQLGFIRPENLLQIKCSEIINLLTYKPTEAITPKRRLARAAFIAQLSITIPELLENTSIPSDIKSEIIRKLLDSKSLNFDSKLRIFSAIANSKKLNYTTNSLIFKTIRESQENF